MQQITLTKRQAQVVGLLAQGLTHKEIARKLFIEKRTVQNHVENAKRRNKTRNCVDLCVYAAVQGAISLEKV